MNEITRIHLGRQPFTIAVDAHKALREYLQAIKVAVGANHKEVLEEVELRMAELLMERGITSEKTILASDIAILKQHLGEPGDFKSDDTDASAEQPAHEAPASTSKRLFRDTQNGMVSGVTAGLAAYFGISAIVIRLIFIALAVLWGWGFLLYIILWLVMPEAKTSSDRLQMQGKPVTVESLKEVVDQADVPGAAQRATRTLAPFFEKVGLIIVILIGVGFLLAGVATIMTGTIGGAYVLLNQQDIFRYSDYTLSARDYIFGSSLLLTILVIGFALTLVGVAMIRRRWFVPGWATAGLVGLFFVGVTVMGPLTPGVVQKFESYATALDRTASRAVQEPFTALHIVDSGENYDNPVRYEYRQAEIPSIEFEYVGDAELSDVQTTVKDGTLIINTAEYDNNPDCSGICIAGEHDMKVTIKHPDLKKITMSQYGSSIEIPEGLTSQALEIEVSNGAYVNLGKTNVATATVQSNDGQGFNRVALEGLSADPMAYDAISVSEEHVIAPRIGKLLVQTNKNCVASDGTNSTLISLDRMPAGGVVANGVTAADIGQFGNLQTQDTANNPFKCIGFNE
ncbi:MAG TPA: PspC domain-containing protein [Candidatus Saccharimonadales bacterium]|nr:PspC domain-containing protein [Candidatus Saccharimonadales bacterium]